VSSGRYRWRLFYQSSQSGYRKTAMISDETLLGIGNPFPGLRCLEFAESLFCLRFHFGSREQVFDDHTLDVCQAEIAPGVTICQAFVIEAQQIQERRV
jgi:hypothetical protein